MGKYQIWDKKSDIYTPSNERFTPEQWAARYPWVHIPGVKMIITTGVINGGCAMEYNAAAAFYRSAGAAIEDGMGEDEVLAAIEDFEAHPPGADEPGVEERTAAALEFLALSSLPDETEQEVRA